MSECKFCQGTVVEVSPGLFKCVGMCEQYFSGSPTGPPPRLEVVATLQRLQAHEVGVPLTQKESDEGLDIDMLTFINRIVERLAPIKSGDAEETIKRVYDWRNKNRVKLMGVFQKGSFDEWYGDMAVSLGLDDQTFRKILYDSLEGLKNQEAQELRAQLGAVMQKRLI